MRSLPAIRADTTEEFSNNGRNLYINYSIDWLETLFEIAVSSSSDQAIYQRTNMSDLLIILFTFHHIDVLHLYKVSLSDSGLLQGITLRTDWLSVINQHTSWIVFLEQYIDDRTRFEAQLRMQNKTNSR
jgi:hypothetical protein